MSVNPISPCDWLKRPSRVRFHAECSLIPIDISNIGPRGPPRLSTKTVSIPVPIYWMHGLHRPVIQLDHQDPNLPSAQKNPSFTLKLPSLTRKPSSHALNAHANTRSCLRSPCLDRGSALQTTDPVIPIDAPFPPEFTPASPVPLTASPESSSSISTPPALRLSPPSYFTPRYRRGSTSYLPETVPLRPCCTRCLSTLSKAMFHDHVRWSPGARRKKRMDEEEERSGSSTRDNLMLKVDEVEFGKVNVREVRDEEFASPDTELDDPGRIAEDSQNARGVHLMEGEPEKSHQLRGNREEDIDPDALDSLRLAELLEEPSSSGHNLEHGSQCLVSQTPDRARRPVRPLPAIPTGSFTPSVTSSGSSESLSGERMSDADGKQHGWRDHVSGPRQPQSSHGRLLRKPFSRSTTSPPVYARAPWALKPTNLFATKSSADLASSKRDPAVHQAEASRFLSVFAPWARIGNVV